MRRFVSTTGGIDEFVTVTCRLASGGARVPLGITSVQYQLANNQPVQPIGSGETLPRFGANITFNGTGRLNGRWEVVLPGDPPPSQRDLLTEATLPLEERGLQRRYRVLEQFDLFLQPTGKIFLPGPDPAKLVPGSTGLHQILLRVEATNEIEGRSSLDGDSNFIPSGGAAGFALPIFRYTILPPSPKIALLSPTANAQLTNGQQLRFSWQGVRGVSGYKLEVQQSDRLIFSALLGATTTSYTAPPWLKQRAGQALDWKIKALKSDGSVLLESETRNLKLKVSK